MPLFYFLYNHEPLATGLDEKRYPHIEKMISRRNRYGLCCQCKENGKIIYIAFLSLVTALHTL